MNSGPLRGIRSTFQEKAIETIEMVTRRVEYA
jgi:hypothetical protein